MWIQRKLRVFSFVVFFFLGFFGALLWGSEEMPLEERPLCEALYSLNTLDFLDHHNQSIFDQDRNSNQSFLFIPRVAKKRYDGKNVVTLRSARVDFDFEDKSVDLGDSGGFYARWKIVMIPFEKKWLRKLEKKTGAFERSKILHYFSHHKNRVEVILSGPFKKNGCEWGDTAQIGSQQLAYQNYAIFDWDFYPKTGRILGIIYEGDEGVHDDFITWFDFSRRKETVVLEKTAAFRLVFETLSDVEGLSH